MGERLGAKSVNEMWRNTHAGSGIKPAGANRIIGFVVFTLLVGFAEEGLLRGIVLQALLPKGAMRAALISSLIFGAAHLANIWQGASPSATIVQVVFSTFLGIGFAGARLYSGTIWPAIGLHALMDLFDAASRGFELPGPHVVTPGRALIPISLTGICALYGWWLMRRAGSFEETGAATDVAIDPAGPLRAESDHTTLVSR